MNKGMNKGTSKKQVQSGAKTRPKPFPPPSPHRDDAMQALRNGMRVQECAARFDVTEMTARRYRKKIETESKVKAEKQGKPVSEPGSKPQNQTEIQTEPVKQVAKPSETLVQSGQEATLAAVTISKPAPITFTLGEAKIPLNPQYLYDAYLYYQDIQRMSPDMNDEFCLGIKTAMKYVWEKFVRREANKIGVGIKEG